MTFTTVAGSGTADSATSYVGTAAADTLTFAGNDLALVNIKSFAGADIINAGAKPFDASFINGNLGSDNIVLAAYSNSRVLGGADSDYIEVNRLAAARANGNKGDDNLRILSSSQGSINGGQGLDTIALAGAHSYSFVSGDLDNDIINLENTSQFDQTVINGNAGNDTVTVQNIALFGNSSAIRGGDGDDTLNATNSATVGVTLSGDNGADNLTGGAQADTLSGGTGTDNLDGGAQNDTINGNAGNDTIADSGGNDTLDGGAGVDNIDANTGTDRVNVTATGEAANRDIVTNFTVNTDILGLNAALTTAGTAVGANAALEAETAAAANANGNAYDLGGLTGGDTNSLDIVTLSAATQANVANSPIVGTTTDGTLLLGSLVAAGVGSTASGIQMDNVGDALYIATVNAGGNGFLYFANSGADNLAVANEIALVGEFTAGNIAGLTAGATTIMA